MAIGLLGCAHIHTPGFIKAIQKRPHLKVAAVWDHDRARAELRAKELGAQVADTPEAVCSDAHIDAIIICSETDRHEPLVKLAASARKKLFAEKPLGVGAKDAAAMADTIEKAGIPFQTGYFMRGMPVHQFIKKAIDEKQLGTITRARAAVCHGGALGGWFDKEWRWMADPRQAGVGAFGDLGTHGLDLLIWMLGDVEAVTATLDNGTGRYLDCDEIGEALFRFKSGAIGSLAASWDDASNPITMEISGMEGHATIVNGEVYFQSKQVDGADGKKPTKNLPEAKHAGFEAFLDVVEGKDAALVSVREAAYRSAVMEAMYQGAREKRWVEVK
ncbi:MAG TPA: Gfo/Idh/MocA family oxidoreductase [Tepidisphaeraceae bacterium]|jgi:predicted dehydrogenase